MNDITTKEFDLIREHIKKNYGISLGDEKKSLVVSRLRSVLQKNNLDNFTDYYNYLINDKTGQAAITFIDKMSTNHTYFMRETDHFDFFRDKALPELEKNSGKKDIRLWCAGCSSGEEPYTLQIIMQEYFGNKANSWDTTILATDISMTVLKKAYKGMYSAENLKSIPEEWKKKYFKKISDDFYEVDSNIKKKLIFKKLNLMDDKFPMKDKLDFIFCRNVMIYFDLETRDKLIKKFYDITKPGGYLFIGHSETLNYSDASYKYIMPAVYQKRI